MCSNTVGVHTEKLQMTFPIHLNLFYYTRVSLKITRGVLKSTTAIPCGMLINILEVTMSGGEPTVEKVLRGSIFIVLLISISKTVKNILTFTTKINNI